MKIEGIAFKLGDNIDTDVILPGKYLVLTDFKELAKHALEGIDPTFHHKAVKGVIIIAGENFGCGSSREHAPIALKYSGVKCIIASSIARIFYRNAINIGLPVLESKDANKKILHDDRISVDLRKGVITNKRSNATVNAQALPHFLLQIIEDGGLVPHLQKILH